MDLHGILRRIESRMAATGKTAQAASRESGKSKDAIRNIQRAVKEGRGGISTQTIAALADPLKTSPGWLLTGEGEPDAVERDQLTVVRVPLISWVSAGALAAPDAVIDVSECPTIVGPNLGDGDFIALEVDGTSMDRISPPGSIIVVNRRDRRLVLNACYVISDPETGEATYKRFRPAPDRFEPVSTFGEHETVFASPETSPRVIGRVRLSMISM